MKEFVSQVHKAKAIPLPVIWTVGSLGCWSTRFNGLPSSVRDNGCGCIWGPTMQDAVFPLGRCTNRGVVINEFKECIVGHENENAQLLEPVLLGR
ncbi:Alpha-1,3-mannosyltransferase cmt1 [Castilleja foliolosa]|uniref:Alpha-1,3-mannosyltransferase cmt1 n=1 Tax=Castilleja foliolosa TaxID=1961234 RepID=A0ABD3CA98_9LAMI